MTAESPYTLQWDALSPSKLPLPMGDLWFPGPTPVLNPNGISIDAAIFAGLISVTDRPIDHATRLVTIGRIYVRSTAMRPNNIQRKRSSYFSTKDSLAYVNCSTMTDFKARISTESESDKNSSGDEIANVKFFAVRPEATRIR